VKVALIGGGAMGSAMLRAGLASGSLAKDTVSVCEVVPERRAALATEFGVHTTGAVSEAASGADAAILAIKPQDLKSLPSEHLSGALVISIMAGVTIATLRNATGSESIIRVMPNTPAAIGAGMSVWTATATVDDASRTFVAKLLGSMGMDLYVDSEAKIDMATAVNGSGPGFVFLLMEAMVDGAVAAGLTREQAETLVLQTFYGSAKYAAASDRSLAELRAQVTSPAGTTAAGLGALESHGVRAAIADAIHAAHARAKELGQPI
jgi:pyrroline-5-carboxylate reductase